MRLKFWRPRKPKPVVVCHELTEREVKSRDLLTSYDETPGSEYFLFGGLDVEYMKHQREANIMRLPSDPNVVSAWYRGIREPRIGESRPGITYDVQEAHQHLVELMRAQPKEQRKLNDTRW